MINFLLSLVLGITAAMLVWVIFVVEKDLSPNILNRLDRIKRKTNITDAPEFKDDINLNAVNTEYKVQALEQILRGQKFTAYIKELIQLADVEWQIDTFIFFSFACAAPCLIFLITPFKLMSLFGLGTFFLPTLYLKRLIDKRFIDFSKQFPDALSLMASSLRAGHPLFSAMDIVTGEMPKPICDVFESTRRDISLGIDTKEAFLSMTKIMPKSIDLRFFITAVLIQKEVGGNLAELLDSLSATIRERFKLLGQLRVSTAQTRISGIVLGLVPVLILLVIFFLNPDYIKPLFTTPDGKIAFVIAIFLIIAGFIAVKKISDIEV